LGLDLEPLAGHFHAGLDFQRHAIVADIEEGRLGIGRAGANYLALFIERLGHDADHFPGARLEPSPGMQLGRNAGLLGHARGTERRKAQGKRHRARS